MFADDMTLDIENSKESTKKAQSLLVLIYEFNKVICYKIIVQKSVVFNSRHEPSKKEIKKKIPFII